MVSACLYPLGVRFRRSRFDRGPVAEFLDSRDETRSSPAADPHTHIRRKNNLISLWFAGRLLGRDQTEPARRPKLRVHTVVATLSIERLRRLCRFRRTAFGLVIG